MYMLKCDVHILMRASWLVTDTAIVCVAMEKYPNALGLLEETKHVRVIIKIGYSHPIFPRIGRMTCVTPNSHLGLYSCCMGGGMDKQPWACFGFTVYTRMRSGWRLLTQVCPRDALVVCSRSLNYYEGITATDQPVQV